MAAMVVMVGMVVAGTAIMVGGAAGMAITAMDGVDGAAGGVQVSASASGRVTDMGTIPTTGTDTTRTIDHTTGTDTIRIIAITGGIIAIGDITPTITSTTINRASASVGIPSSWCRAGGLAAQHPTR
jgi:hypothetical protein